MSGVAAAKCLQDPLVEAEGAVGVHEREVNATVDVLPPAQDLCAIGGPLDRHRAGVRCR